jgi:hypothetical protein
MITSHPALAATERIIEPMMALARCSKRQPIIIAGANTAEHMFELHRQGYARVRTTAHCGLPAGQYDVALIDWRQRSIKSLETTLDWLVDFVGPAGVLIVWVDPQQPAGNRTLRSILERHSLAIEAGTNQHHGSAIAARRIEPMPATKVA